MTIPHTVKSYCIVTVTTPDFVVGTLVMLDSFFQHNRWFDGDLVIIHNCLPEGDQRQLRCRFPDVQFLQISAEIDSAIKQFLTVRPDLASHQSQFYALDAIRLNQYQRLLFCDSDLLFRGSIEPLFQLNQPLIATGDGAYYRGNARSQEHFLDAPKTDGSNPTLLYNTFNSGFLIFANELLGAEPYCQLLNYLAPEQWRETTTPHTDQFILNRHYSGQQSLVGAQYNYLVGHQQLIFERFNVRIDSAKVLHFTGLTKPWLVKQSLRLIQHNPTYIKAAKYWYDAHIASLLRLHLALGQSESK